MRRQPPTLRSHSAPATSEVGVRLFQCNLRGGSALMDRGDFRRWTDLCAQPAAASSSKESKALGRSWALGGSWALLAAPRGSQASQWFGVAGLQKPNFATCSKTLRFLYGSCMKSFTFGRSGFFYAFGCFCNLRTAWWAPGGCNLRGRIGGVGSEVVSIFEWISGANR